MFQNQAFHVKDSVFNKLSVSWLVMFKSHRWDGTNLVIVYDLN